MITSASRQPQRRGAQTRRHRRELQMVVERECELRAGPGQQQHLSLAVHYRMALSILRLRHVFCTIMFL